MAEDSDVEVLSEEDNEGAEEEGVDGENEEEEQYGLNDTFTLRNSSAYSKLRINKNSIASSDSQHLQTNTSSVLTYVPQYVSRVIDDFNQPGIALFSQSGNPNTNASLETGSNVAVQNEMQSNMVYMLVDSGNGENPTSQVVAQFDPQTIEVVQQNHEHQTILITDDDDQFPESQCQRCSELQIKSPSEMINK